MIGSTAEDRCLKAQVPWLEAIHRPFTFYVFQSLA